MEPSPSTASSRAPDEAISSVGLPARRVAGLAYLPVAGFILLVIERTSASVRFHAAQSSILYTVWALGAAVQLGVSWYLDRATAAHSGIEPLLGCLGAIAYLMIIAALVACGVTAWKGRTLRLPGVARLADVLMARLLTASR